MVLEDKKPCKLDKDGFLEKKIELLKRTQRVFHYVLLYKNYLKSDLLRNMQVDPQKRTALEISVCLDI